MKLFSEKFILNVFSLFKRFASFLTKHIRGFLISLFLIIFWGSFYFFWAPSYYFVIPASIDDYWGIPLVQIEIGNKNYELELDLGVKLSTLRLRDLNEIDKKFYGSFSSWDVHGNTYESDIYQVLDVKIHDFLVPTMKIMEESSKFIANNTFHGELDRISCSGRMGREVFEGKNFFLDFCRSRIILCKNFNNLVRDCYKLEQFVKVPFHINEMGICVEVQTDTGIKTLVLDTGSSHSMVRSSPEEEALSREFFHDLPVWCSRKCILGGRDFGARNFCLFEISPSMKGMDGLLGMDFLKDHAVYLDRDQSMAYIGKSSEVCP